MKARARDPKPSIMADARLAHRHDVVDDDARAVGEAQRLKRLGPHLLGVANDGVHLGHAGEAAGLNLGGAARDDDAGLGALAAQLADGLCRLAHRLGRDGAGIHDDGVVEPCRLGVAPHRLGFVGVEAAAEGDDTDGGGPLSPLAGRGLG